MALIHQAVEVAGLPDDGTTSASALIQQALDAVEAAGGGTVLLPAGSYRASGLTLAPNVTLRGQGRNATHLVTTGGDLLTVSDGHWALENLRLRSANGGRCVVQAGMVWQARLSGVALVQENPDLPVWDNAGHGYIDMLCIDFDVVHPANTVPSWKFDTANGDVNRNTWTNFRHTGSPTSAAYAWKLDSLGASSFIYDNVWRDGNFEVTPAGGIWLGGCVNFTFDNLLLYDTDSSVDHFLSAGAGSGGLPTRVGSIRNCGNRNTVFPQGIAGFKCRTDGTTAFHFDACTGLSAGVPWVMDLGSTLDNSVRAGVF